MHFPLRCRKLLPSSNHPARTSEKELAPKAERFVFQPTWLSEEAFAAGGAELHVDALSFASDARLWFHSYKDNHIIT